MFRRLFIAVVLLLCLAAGCGRPDVGEMMKKSMERSMPQKTLYHTEWTGAERVVVFVLSPHDPMAAAVGSGFSWAAGAKGAAVGAAAGAAALSAVPGAGVLAAGVMGMLIPGPRKVSSTEFEGKVKGFLGEEYLDRFAEAVKQAVKSQAKGQVMLVTGPPESIRFPDLKPTDSVIHTHLMLMFIGDKPQMLAQLHWSMLVNGDRYQEISQRMEAKAQELQKRRAGAKEWQTLQDLYDGHGSLMYSSPPHAAKEWLANNGELLRSEWRRAVDDLTSKLQQALAGGKPS
jgi:hypothetical protein